MAIDRALGGLWRALNKMGINVTHALHPTDAALEFVGEATFSNTVAFDGEVNFADEVTIGNKEVVRVHQGAVAAVDASWTPTAEPTTGSPQVLPPGPRLASWVGCMSNTFRLFNLQET